MSLSRNVITYCGITLVSMTLVTACSTETNSSQTSSLQNDLESARALTLSCGRSQTPVSQLAEELSRQCRSQNADLRAKGLPACQQDECSDVVTLQSAQKGLPGAQYIYNSHGQKVGIQVLISTDLRLSTQEKTGLICYAPVLKAEELIGSMASRCH